MRMTVKPMLALIAVVALLCTVVPFYAWGLGTDADNLLSNGGFESDADGWMVGGNSAVQTGDTHSGDKAMLLSHSSAWGETLTRVVAVEKNTDYTLTFWAKRASGTTVWDMFVYNKDTMTVLPLTGGNNWITAGALWTQNTLTFNSGAAANLFLKFCPESSTGGTLLVDDVVLTKKSTEPDIPDQPVVEALTNGDFEAGLEGWTVGGNTALDTTASHGGEKAVLLSHPSAWGEALTRTVAVEKNTDYILTFWYKRVSGNGAWNIYIYDGGISQVLPYTSGENWFGTSGPEWAQHTVRFNSGSNTAVFLKFCPESAIAGTFLLDDVSLVKEGEEPDQPDNPDQPPMKPLENGGFEAGLEGWTVGGNTALDTTASHSGEKAVLLSHPTAWGEALTRTVAVEKNTDYILTFWYKRVSGNGAWNIYIYDGGISQVLPYTSGENWFGTSGPEWAQHTVRFNSGSNTSVFLKFCPESAVAGTFLLDDVSLVKEGEEPDQPDNPDQPQVKPLENGGFEAGIEGWQVGGDSAIDTSGPHGGKNAMLLSHPTAWGEALTRTVAVEENTDYTFTFWYKRVSGGGAWDAYVLNPTTMGALTYQSGTTWFGSAEKTWIEHTITFHSGNLTSVVLKFCPESATAGTFLLDDVSLLKEGEEPDPPTPPEPPVPSKDPLMLSSFSVTQNRPLNAEANLLKNGSFESVKSALWNVDTFLGDTVTVVEDPTAQDGNKSLYFHTSGTTESEAQWHVFWVDVQPNTEYVFSAWLKGAFMSQDNAARATVGVIDPDNQRFLVDRTQKFSTDLRQLVPPAWDTRWHLRSVSFHSGEKTRIGIALYGYGSQLWIDDMALFEVDSGEKYTSANSLASVSLQYDLDHYTCENQDSLTDNVRMDDASSDFWQSGTGWRNGFLSFAENKYEYGTSLKYTASEEKDGVHYIKWLEVKPHTEYVFSADMKVLQDGYGKLVLLDGKKRGVMSFAEADFSSVNYGEDWFQFVVGFNSDVFDTIGIGIVDAGGEALFDNIRLFEAADGADVTDPYVEPPKAPEEEPDDPPFSEPMEWPEEPVIPEPSQPIQPDIGEQPEPYPDDPTPIDPIPDEPQPGISPITEDTDLMWLWIGLGTVVVLAGGAVAVFLLMKKRKKTAPPSNE